MSHVLHALVCTGGADAGAPPVVRELYMLMVKRRTGVVTRVLLADSPRHGGRAARRPWQIGPPARCRALRHSAAPQQHIRPGMGEPGQSQGLRMRRLLAGRCPLWMLGHCMRTHTDFMDLSHCDPGNKRLCIIQAPVMSQCLYITSARINDEHGRESALTQTCYGSGQRAAAGRHCVRMQRRAEAARSPR